jgi:polysaccharide deacetylase family protein (PEP-CTERM system associated)
MTLMPSTVHLQPEAAAAPFTAAPSSAWRLDQREAPAEAAAAPALPPTVILSFDVEEHYRIEAAAGLDIDAHLKAHYGRRMELCTWWLLEQLAARDIKATFFIVGQIAAHNPGLVRAIHAAGHEVASHGWEHRRIHGFTRAAFAEDTRRSKQVLEQVTGAAVVGYRAPTFSVVRQTAWALDVLVEQGFLYDSSIFPVRHDRYGVPGAPRVPFWAQGREHSILELPLATWRFLGMNLPVAGGGYFRLFPLFMLHRALGQIGRRNPPVAMLYFHPWEFDTDQARLPLGRLGSFRTYVGVGGSRLKLANLLQDQSYVCAREVVHRLRECALETHPVAAH